MKYFLLAIFSMTFPVWAHPGIMEVFMDETIPHEIPMHHSVTLTIQFPHIIDGLNGAGFTADATKPFGEFLVSYTEPNNYFSLYPLVENPLPRNLNIIVKGKIYVLRPYLTPDPNKAWTALIFKDPETAKDKEPPHPRIYKSTRLPTKKLETSSTAKIIGMIDMTKMLSQIKEPILKELLETMPDISVSLRQNDLQEYGTHRVFLDIVSRHDKYDILVFGVRIINDSQENIVLNPESFTVRCGNQVYTQVVSDFQGRVQPRESAIGYFAIIGTAEGSPNYLSPNNTFQVHIDVLRPSHD